MTAAVQAKIKERPILFSGPMVQAILDGQKTQTRRIAWKMDIHREMRKLDPSMPALWAGAVHPARESGYVSWYPGNTGGLAELTKKQYDKGFECPYGKLGDRLWVRETWAARISYDSYSGVSPEVGRVEYRQSPNWTFEIPEERGKWRPSIFMPRWASRITLEITKIRVERLQEITEEDAKAEGVVSSRAGTIASFGEALALAQFRILWDVINHKRASWESNPWVWVVEFKRID